MARATTALLVAAALPAGAAAAGRVRRDRASPLPQRLTRGARTPAELVLPSLGIALVSRDEAGLRREIAGRSDPTSPRYAQWLTTAEVTAYAAAPDAAVARVTAWLRAAGIAAELNNHRDWLTARNVSAAAVEALLGAELHQHYDTVTGATVPRVAGAYSLPEEVAPHVLKVFPVHTVPLTRLAPRRAAPQPASDATAGWPKDCKGLKIAGMITPAVVQKRYNFTAFGSNTGGSIAAMLPGPVGVVAKDIAYIQSTCGLPDHPLDKFVGKNAASKCTGKRPDDDMCAEAAIDSQIIVTNAGGIHAEFWSEECDTPNDFTCMFKAINDKGDAAPRVFSFSFGDPETERDDDVPVTDKEFAKSVAKGITLVAASGDCGACKKTLSGKYVANYPPSSQYILGVGGTSFVQPAVIGDERAVVGGYSGGGFSSQFARPAWQGAAVSRYLSSGVKLPKASKFDASGRGVPDISALSGGDGNDCWQIRYGNTDDGEPTGWGCMGGTSTAGPFVASLVAKLNAARLAKGLGTMGFINPWLYSTAANASGAVYDVTTGDNKGFYAYAGWDAVTGLGTPNYAALETLALKK